MVHHGNEEIEEHNDVDDGEGPKHEKAKKSSELLDASQLKVVQIYEAENGPDESLDSFPQTEIRGGENYISEQLMMSLKLVV